MTTLVTYDDFAVGDQVDLTFAVDGLLQPIAQGEFGFTDPVTDLAGLPLGPWILTTTAEDWGQVLDAGTLDTDGLHYTAQIALTVLSAVSARAFSPGGLTTGYLDVTGADGDGPWTAGILTFAPKRGGKRG